MILAGFDAPGYDDGDTWLDATTDANADVLADGWSASIDAGLGFNKTADKSSEDLTFGSLESPAARSKTGAVQISEANGWYDRTIVFTLTNNTGGAVDMANASFRFDWAALPDYADAPQSFSVYLAKDGAFGNTDPILFEAVDVSSYDVGYADFDFALADLELSSYSMADEGSIGFWIQADRNSTTGTKVKVDNLAVTVIPEPATLGMIVASAGGLLVIRRRFML